MITSTYLVDGMTCSHCVASVTEELTAVPGVDAVNVDLVKGGSSRVHVESSEPLDLDAVRVAIDEAGYTLSSAS
ncbi:MULTISPECIES: heavy-metal-associated domain-containing protein [unclassified Salinibacterium]|uniref:heavy-metal-associated domain-containing protein n=1 Tax=unclassified Salinibacterium TaxID=2632331 RepID=UPI00141E2BC6|nr:MULTISPECIES: heavy-metal-associated domain-containing protein [unclassified Salinibacterium]